MDVLVRLESRPRRARRDKNKTLGLQQPQRLGYEVWPITPWRGTHSSDLSCANGLSVLLALRISQRGEHNSLLTGHPHHNLVAHRDTRNPRASAPDRRTDRR
jgi:hypothetical protein